MKKRIGYICLLVSFLLIGCTFLSHRVEETMMTQAVVRTLKGSNVILPDKVLFKDSGVPVMYDAEEGLGWNTGLRAAEVPSRSYEVLGDGKLKMESAFMDLIYTASREPIAGQKMNRINGDKRESAPDQYLVVYLNGVPQSHEMPVDASLVRSSENVMLLDIPASALPFMEHEAKGLFGSIWGLQWRIYSITDLEQLVGSLPLIALAAVLALIPMVLFLLGVCFPPCLTDKDPVLRLHVGVGIAFMAGFVGVLYAIRLPSSLVPKEIIFQWDHYSAELSTALNALQLLEEPGLAVHLAQSQTVALWILLAGAAVLAVLLLVSLILRKKAN